ncbi:SGNH/GDSL hydrolase family protein [Pseudonocardia abyssalis]|uniref:SGNH/GDSL hydrolase family protein n=1 Tax=Pseudonocardia abyssalis TaxID=2792008 RepID=A0ABS6UNN4_9PSEU|nr:SGNH/GDSL hydrolase family protein [Pseudonocardia abyssalis]MBW0118215.1 SGNH/GDSL hydrolase family protein [Pseudonocardia abyssalis]MBW0133870.1 SGNH/GDSL hydrolase family protein [Pseudonocardia abyssalis]
MPPTRLTVLGDSFVEGRGDPAPEGGYRGWVPRLADLLGLPAGSVRNLGAHGATTQDVLDHQIGRALVGKPPLIGVVVGVNDLVSDYDPARFRANLNEIFSVLCGMDTVVFTADYPDIPSNLPVPEGFRRLMQGRFAEANAAMRAAAASTGALCLDLAGAPEWRPGPAWSSDGLHPSPEGHQRFAASMAELVARDTGLVAA